MKKKYKKILNLSITYKNFFKKNVTCFDILWSGKYDPQIKFTNIMFM